MSKQKIPVTAAVRILREKRIDFTNHFYDYQGKGGTAQGAEVLGVDEYAVIKTLIMEDEHKRPLLVLMHGNKQVSTKALARILGVKTITPCDPKVANHHSGYQVGDTSPFGTRRRMPVYIESSILDLPRVYINGGKRGYLVGIAPAEIQRILQPTLVQVAVQAGQFSNGFIFSP